ncbi:hypothetical protein A71_236 [Escherichia phage A7_1]|uniref:Uncharacterized protein n=2 Tax=Vequintavirinae TaxID=1911928 RepID=A0AAF0AMS6_9CAUD|nr:hypothetical protein A71_236 [Escherichia phage A7_1]UZZ64319.1 hypothetical protein A54_79 [Escherichia phage A5-4]WBF77664.1 hypothetical protein A73_26 [Escherichia phage A73]
MPLLVFRGKIKRNKDTKMNDIVSIIGLLGIGYIATSITMSYFNKRRDKMFCYFEYRYRGKVGSSRDYGPMLEIDAVGAMQYRQSLGAEIIFEVYRSTEEEIHDIIDERQYYHEQQTKRRA